MNTATLSTRGLPADCRRNLVLLVGNYVAFGIGLAFFNTSTVMPLFLSHLTDSAPLIGLVSAIFPLGWMIPQLLSARWISHRRERKPFLIVPSLAAPLIFAALAGIMYWDEPAIIDRLLSIFIISMVIMALIDGIIGVPWLDFVGTAIPARLRGRMMGIQEVLFAIVSVGIGAVVGYFLSPDAPAFPLNFAWLAASAAMAFFLAWMFLLPLREPSRSDCDSASESAGRLASPPWGVFLPQLWHILRTDRGLLTLVLLRVLNGCMGFAFPFYVLFATQHLGISPALTGFYLSVQLVASAVGSMILGMVYERRGSKIVIRAVTAAGLAVPILALGIPIIGLPVTIIPWAYALVFLFLGIGGTSSAAIFVGYMNFLIDYSEPANRPAYLGLANTLSGPVALTGFVGGWILEQAGFRPLFLLTGAILLLAQFVASKLPAPAGR